MTNLQLQRYDLEEVGHYDDERDHVMVESAEGEWVHWEEAHSEFERLRAENERLKRAANAGEEIYKIFGQPPDEPRVLPSLDDVRGILADCQVCRKTPCQCNALKSG